LKKIRLIFIIMMLLLLSACSKEEESEKWRKADITGTVTYIDLEKNTIEVIHGMKKTISMEDEWSNYPLGTYEMLLDDKTKGIKIENIHVFDEVDVWIEGEMDEVNKGNSEKELIVKRTKAIKIEKTK